MFFKNEASPAPALVTSINSSVVIASNNGHAKTDLAPMPSKIETSKGLTNSNSNMEDNREKDFKDKLKDKLDKESRRKELDGYVGRLQSP